MKPSFVNLFSILVLSAFLVSCGGSGISKRPVYKAPEDSVTQEEDDRQVDEDEGDCFGSNCDDNDNEGGPGGPNLPDDGNEPGDNNNSEEQDELVPLPEDDEASEANIFGNTSKKETYDISQYEAVEGTNDLSGTWVVIHNSSEAFANTAHHLSKKYVFIIKKPADDGDEPQENNQYLASNCTGLVKAEETYADPICVDSSGAQVSCDSSYHNILPPLLLKKEFFSWADNTWIKTELTDLDTSDDGDEEQEFSDKIDLPLFNADLWRTERGIALYKKDDSWASLESKSGRYQAVKVSTETDLNLGTSKASLYLEQGPLKESITPDNTPIICATQVRININTKDGDSYKQNYISGLYIATTHDLQFAFSSDVELDSGKQALELRRHYVREGIIDYSSGEGVPNKPYKPGSYTSPAEDEIINLTEDIDNEKIDLDLLMKSESGIESALRVQATFDF